MQIDSNGALNFFRGIAVYSQKTNLITARLGEGELCYFFTV